MAKILVSGAVLFLMVLVAYPSLADISDKCLSCMAEASGGKVNQCSGGYCGPYKISEPYYKDCGKPGAGYQRCTKQKACSELCIKSYMERYATKCPRPITCEDYARVHVGGPGGCTKPSTDYYWNTVKKCCNGRCK